MRYERITNIGQREGIIERLFNLGTVFLDTAGHSKTGHELSMHFLENPTKIYNWLENMVSQKNNNNT